MERDTFSRSGNLGLTLIDGHLSPQKASDHEKCWEVFVYTSYNGDSFHNMNHLT